MHTLDRLCMCQTYRVISDPTATLRPDGRAAVRLFPRPQTGTQSRGLHSTTSSYSSRRHPGKARRRPKNRREPRRNAPAWTLSPWSKTGPIAGRVGAYSAVSAATLEPP
eukprot:scaffold2580_cov388-Prasinococcus_capsulatus_cf.AAC.22